MCTIAGIVEPKAFLVELNTLIFFLVCFLNVFALVNYCRNAGNPYKNDKFKKYVHKYKAVIIMWNLAFIVKFILSFCGITVIDFTEEHDQVDDFWYSVETFLNILFTEIIPFYLVMDKKFVKIFTMKFLEAQVEGSTVVLTNNEDPSSMDAQLIPLTNESG